VPHDLEWTATFFKEAPMEFFLRPALPQRPVVVTPNCSSVIPPEEVASFFVLLPANIEIVVSASGREVVLGSVPSRVLSETWFGSPTEGELCYSLPFNAEKDLENLNPKPHHIVWPVEILNRSSEELRFEKLCLRPQFVGLYSGDTHIWSSPVHIIRESSFKGSTVKYDKNPPPHELDLMELSKPQKREDRILSRLTFGTGVKRDTIFGN